MALTKAHFRMVQGAPVNVKDYGAVGDGSTNDTTAIEAAFAAADDSVYFPVGTYYIAGSTITIPDNLKISGDGDASKITCDASGRTDPNADHLFVVGSNVIIRDMFVDGDRGNAVQEIRSFSIDGSDEIIFDNVSFSDHGVGVDVEDGNRVQIINCNFVSGTQSKAHIVTRSGGPNYAENILIQNNYFGTTQEEAIDIQAYCRSVIIDGNTFFDNHTGTDVDGTEIIDIGGASNFDIVVSNNRVNGNNEADAFVWVKLETINVAITGNIIKNLNSVSGLAAFRVSNSTHVNITGNTVQNATGLVLVQSRGAATDPTDHLTISGNSASGLTGKGIYLQSSSPTNVIIDGNSIVDNASTDYGIYCVTGSKQTISNNIIQGFGNDGIRIDSGISDCVVSGNTVYDCSDALSIATDGATISGNNCSDSNAMGLRLSGDKCSVTGNIFNNSTNDGINLSGADKSAVTGNVCTGNNKGINVSAASADCAVVGNMLIGNTTANLDNAANLTGSSVNASNVT